MILKLKCINNHQVELEETELMDKENIFCWCGEPLRVENVKEIVNYDIEKRAENHLKKWVAEIGWDNVIDMIKNCKLPKVKEIYKRLLEKKGFNIK